jgi:hypothetical protein
VHSNADHNNLKKKGGGGEGMDGLGGRGCITEAKTSRNWLWDASCSENYHVACEFARQMTLRTMPQELRPILSSRSRWSPAPLGIPAHM